MRLKVSPKAAVQAVDALVKAGTKTRQLLLAMYDKLDEDIKNEIEAKEAAHEEAKQKALQAAMSQPDEVDVDMGITSDEYDKRVAVCKQQEATFLEELKGHSVADEAFVLSCSYILEVAKRASELFMRSQPDQKNRLLRFVFANASVQGEKLDYKLKNVFAGIVQCNKSKNWLPRLDSNQ